MTSDNSGAWIRQFFKFQTLGIFLFCSLSVAIQAVGKVHNFNWFDGITIGAEAHYVALIVGLAAWLTFDFLRTASLEFFDQFLNSSKSFLIAFGSLIGILLLQRCLQWDYLPPERVDLNFFSLVDSPWAISASGALGLPPLSMTAQYVPLRLWFSPEFNLRLLPMILSGLAVANFFLFLVKWTQSSWISWLIALMLNFGAGYVTATYSFGPLALGHFTLSLFTFFVFEFISDQKLKFTELPPLIGATTLFVLSINIQPVTTIMAFCASAIAFSYLLSNKIGVKLVLLGIGGATLLALPISTLAARIPTLSLIWEPNSFWLDGSTSSFFRFNSRVHLPWAAVLLEVAVGLLILVELFLDAKRRRNGTRNSNPLLFVMTIVATTWGLFLILNPHICRWISGPQKASTEAHFAWTFFILSGALIFGRIAMFLRTNSPRFGMLQFPLWTILFCCLLLLIRPSFSVTTPAIWRDRIDFHALDSLIKVYSPQDDWIIPLSFIGSSTDHQLNLAARLYGWELGPRGDFLLSVLDSIYHRRASPGKIAVIVGPIDRAEELPSSTWSDLPGLKMDAIKGLRIFTVNPRTQDFNQSLSLLIERLERLSQAAKGDSVVSSHFMEVRAALCWLNMDSEMATSLVRSAKPLMSRDWTTAVDALYREVYKDYELWPAR